MKIPVLTVLCNEPEGDIERTVYKFSFTGENLQKFWEQASKFPTLLGAEIKSAQDFWNIFISQEGQNLTANGLFYCIDDFVGVFYLTDISNVEATVHYSFFDQRHRGRKALVKKMIKYIMDTYHFQRINAFVPLYTTKYVRHFVASVGFTLEGKKRKAAYFNGEWYDVLMYGMTTGDVYGETTKEDLNGDESQD